ncbi:MAG: hypothetical protein IV108_00570 [Burkholderiales bacterium]|nr:hypothetical protein [Burkholderiales bacterium]
MRRIIETTYTIASIVPLVYLGLVVAEAKGVEYFLGALIPPLAVISLLLVLTGVALTVLAYRRKDRIWHLVLATLMSSPIAILAGFTWLFG